MLEPSTKLAKSELVYRELRGKILSGRYVAGYRLVLDQIARDLGVSTVPVREAVRRLEAEKLVSFTRNVGAEVSSVDLGDYANAMQTLAIMEGAATALAAPHLTEEELAEATRANEEMAALLAAVPFDSAQFTQLNARFHRMLWHPCPNAHLNHMLDQEWGRVAAIRRTQFVFTPERAQTSVAEHAEMLRLIREGAPSDDIERVARNHKMRTLRDVVDGRGHR
ncbi:MAG: GntR family transcriptional regulator [Propionibacteriaceae bacterium]|nr:GntR family transcriptional regulator [Propionibacteriaceae bacterium]